MLSVRQIARSIPRNTSRIASYSTRTAARPAFQSSTRQSLLLTQRLQPFRATFSTTSSRFDDVSQELSAKLEQEISLESEESGSATDSDTNSQTFLSQNEWTIEDTPGEQEVLLKRSYDDESITVAFSIVDLNSPAMLPEDEADEAFMDEEDEVAETGQSGGANTKGAINQGKTGGGNFKVAPEDSIAPADREELRDEDDYSDAQSQSFPANVNVLIQRPNKGALRVSLVTDNGRFTIHGVTHLPDTTAATTAQELLHHTPDSLYTGPPFQQLDEEVQGLLEQYLDVRGINTALALFIPDYIDVKEQKEYLSWLGRVKDFVD